MATALWPQHCARSAAVSRARPVLRPGATDRPSAVCPVPDRNAATRLMVSSWTKYPSCLPVVVAASGPATGRGDRGQDGRPGSGNDVPGIANCRLRHARFVPRQAVVLLRRQPLLFTRAYATLRDGHPEPGIRRGRSALKWVHRTFFRALIPPFRREKRPPGQWRPVFPVMHPARLGFRLAPVGNGPCIWPPDSAGLVQRQPFPARYHRGRWRENRSGNRHPPRGSARRPAVTGPAALSATAPLPRFPRDRGAGAAPPLRHPPRPGRSAQTCRCRPSVSAFRYW